MHVLLDSQAKESLKNKKIPENSAGVFEQSSGEFCWWYNVGDVFDSGEEETFKLAFSKIKNLTINKFRL
jgi:hypothetical protein